MKKITLLVFCIFIGSILLSCKSGPGSSANLEGLDLLDARGKDMPLLDFFPKECRSGWNYLDGSSNPKMVRLSPNCNMGFIDSSDLNPFSTDKIKVTKVFRYPVDTVNCKKEFKGLPNGTTILVNSDVIKGGEKLTSLDIQDNLPEFCKKPEISFLLIKTNYIAPDGTCKKASYGYALKGIE